ncbi:MAG: (2Fe-2S) ferredoxin domain-containing protein [Endomicrobia bacterium]|nr:(2Fe-2S) ferredoxin domain-containing protein [Endomicrobiia bacterium]
MASPREVLQLKKEKAKEVLQNDGFFRAKRVYVGLATCEIAAGSQPVMDIFQSETKGMPDVFVSKKGCAGRCNLEPTVEVVENGKDTVKYVRVNEEKARQIIERHLKKGEIISEWVIK